MKHVSCVTQTIAQRIAPTTDGASTVTATVMTASMASIAQTVRVPRASSGCC
mgnify:CR=1 FL=1